MSQRRMEKDFLLRISPLETYEKKKVFFDKISQVAKLDIPMSKTGGVWNMRARSLLF